MVDNPKSESLHPSESEQSKNGENSEKNVTNTDNIQQLIDENMEALQLADLRSERGGRELARVIKQAEEIGYNRGFFEGVIEEQVQKTCNDIVGYMLEEIDSGSKTVTRAESTDEPDSIVTQKAILRARKILIDADFPAQVNFHTSQSDTGDTKYNFNLTIDLQPNQAEGAE